MHKKIPCIFLAFVVMAIIGIQVPATAISVGNSTKDIIKTSTATIQSEDINLVVAVSQTIDVNEPIYVMAAGIRDAKATYVKPLTMDFKLMSNMSGTVGTVISDHYAYYDTTGTWTVTSGAEITALNSYLYYTIFNPFGYSAALSVQVTMTWLAPWHQVVTASKTQDFGVGNWYNITNIIGATGAKIKNSVLSKVNLGINISMGLLDSAQATMKDMTHFMDQIDMLINSAAVDPDNLNFYIVDLIGTSSNPGPMYYIAMDDLYSYIPDLPTRISMMDARQAYIYQQLQASFQVLAAKVGTDTDASDGVYSYTITFVNQPYEYFGADSAYIQNPATATYKDSCVTTFVHSDKYGNVTGGSWAQHKTCSLEFLLEPFTGANKAFKSTISAARNDRAPRKSIIINTMGPYWPILNSFYMFWDANPKNIAYKQVATSHLPVQTTPDNTGKVLIQDDSLAATLPYYKRVVLGYNTIGGTDHGTSPVGGVNNDMWDAQDPANLFGGSLTIMNFSQYIQYMAQGMADSYYYWVCLGGGAPFSKLTRDTSIGSYGTLISHGIMDDLVQIGPTCNASLLNVGTGAFSAPISFTVPNYRGYTMFRMLDMFAHITPDRKMFNVVPTPIGVRNTEYYKIETGQWVDAFFNGTNIAQHYGTLADPTYITAKIPTFAPVNWYSPKAPSYSFQYQDAWAFYRLGGLTNYNVPSQYAWIPFVGPNQQVPIGWMTSPNMWFSVVGTYDIGMALDYLYGGIFMGYEETMLGYKNLGATMLTEGMTGTGVTNQTLMKIVNLVQQLDPAWETLNLTGIDDIGAALMSIIQNPEKGQRSMPEQIMRKVTRESAVAFAVLNVGQPNLPGIDQGLATSGSDLHLDGIGDAIQKLINGSIAPAISLCTNMLNQVMSYVHAVKNFNFSSAISLNNTLMASLSAGWNGLTDYIGGLARDTATTFSTIGSTISSVASQVNNSISSVTNKVINWTKGQIDGFASMTQSGFNSVVTTLNSTIFNGLNNVNNVVYSGGTTLLNGVKDALGKVSSGIKKTGASVASVIQTAGEAVGTGIGMAAGSSLGIVGTAVGGVAGYYLGQQMGNGWSGLTTDAFNGAANLIDQGTTAFYNTGSTLLGDAYGLAKKAIKTGGQVAGNILTTINQAFSTGINVTNNVLDGVGIAINGVSSWGTSFAQSMGSSVQSFGDTVSAGVTNVWASATDLANSTVSWTKTELEGVMKQNMETARSVMRTVEGSVTNVFNTVNLIEVVLGQVSDVLANLATQVNSALTSVQNLFNQTTSFLVALAGNGLNLAVNFAGDLAGQLSTIESQIQQSSGFYTVINTLYSKINQAQQEAAALEYAQEAMGNNVGTLFFKWADVFQPISDVEGGNSGLRIYQMGASFANQLFLVATYKGQPVNLVKITCNASRLALSNESVPGGILQARIPVYQAHDANGNDITGVYYVSLNQTIPYDWYGDRKVDNDPIVTGPAIAGDYLLRTDINYTTDKGVKLANTWVEKTTLFKATLTADAFPVINIQTTYPDAITAGTAEPLKLTIANEMHSSPIVSIDYSMSTDSGFLITSHKVADVQLPSDDDGARLYTFTWTPSSSTPSGTYDFIISVTEQNGDVTTAITTVTITSQSPLNNILGWLIGIFGGSLGSLGLGAFITTKRNAAKMPSIGKDALPGSCSINDARDGKCSISGASLECDPETRECKFKF